MLSIHTFDPAEYIGHSAVLCEYLPTDLCWVRECSVLTECPIALAVTVAMHGVVMTMFVGVIAMLMGA